MSSWHYKAGVVCQPEVTLGDAVEEVSQDDAALHQCRSEEEMGKCLGQNYPVVSLNFRLSSDDEPALKSEQCW